MFALRIMELGAKLGKSILEAMCMIPNMSVPIKLTAYLLYL